MLGIHVVCVKRTISGLTLWSSELQNHVVLIGGHQPVGGRYSNFYLKFLGGGGGVGIATFI
jgi:hypothetical protein